MMLEYSVAARRLDLPHTNIRRFGTISNTVAEATRLEGVIRRKAAAP